VEAAVFCHQNTKTRKYTEIFFFGGIWCFGASVAGTVTFYFATKTLKHGIARKYIFGGIWCFCASVAGWVTLHFATKTLKHGNIFLVGFGDLVLPWQERLRFNATTY